MGYTIKHFTEEEQKAFAKEHELANPKEWAIMDGSFVLDFCDSKEEVKKFLAELTSLGTITGSFDSWVTETADHFNLPEATILQTIRDYLQLRGYAMNLQKAKEQLRDIRNAQTSARTPDSINAIMIGEEAIAFIQLCRVAEPGSVPELLASETNE